MTEGNVLYYGDNLDVLRRHVRDESVDLVYLDPPFNSNATYNVLFKEHGEKSAAQVRAFEDTWVWDTTARLAYEEVVEQGGRVADAMRAFRTLLGGSDMLAYLAMMAPRLVELRRVLKPTGSLFLHCDPTASHYLKLTLDAIFGPQRFRTEIIWKRTNAKGLAFQGMPNDHDTILYYVLGDEFTWNRPFKPHDEQYLESFYRYTDPAGRRYRLSDLTNPNRNRPNLTYEWHGHTRVWRWTRERMEKADRDGLIHYSSTGLASQKRFLDEMEGTAVDSLWTDIPPVQPQSAERLGYPTQKPLALLERIISIGTKPGDIVLDPFCGCGTAIDAAQGLGRRWVGIDITHLSIGLIKHRLAGRYGPEFVSTYRTVGEPTTADDAAVLARDDPFQFQAWALGLVGARIAGSDRKGGDKGIDGRLYFHEGGGETRQIILSVKAGGINPGYLDALWGVIEREDAQIGVLISFQQPSAGMRARAAEAGFYESPWGKHPRLQLRTIAELLDGKGIDYPHVTGSNVTHKRAQRARQGGSETMELFGDKPSISRDS